MSLNSSGIPESSGMLKLVLLGLGAIALVVASIAFQFYAPCNFWRGSSLLSMPARCVPELVQPQ